MEKEFDVSAIFKVVKEHWLAILAIALLFAIIVFAADSFLSEERYQTSFKLLIINSNDANFAQQAILSANELLGDIYAELSQSDAIISHIKDDISEVWPEVPESVIKNSLKAASNNSGFISYTVTTNNDELSKDIAVSASRIIPEYLEKSGYGAKVEIINNPGEARQISNTTLYTAVAFVAGVLFAWIFFFIRLFFNTSIETKKDIMSYFSQPVLGEIPVWEKE